MRPWACKMDASRLTRSQHLPTPLVRNRMREEWEARRGYHTEILRMFIRKYQMKSNLFAKIMFLDQSLNTVQSRLSVPFYYWDISITLL